MRVTGDDSEGIALSIDAEGGFPEFYRDEYRAVVGLAFALCGHLQTAEDLAQDAFVAAARKWPRLARYDKPGAWVRRVVANRAVSAYRRRAAEKSALTRLGRSANVTLEDVPPADEEVWGAVRTLPKRQAQMVALVYLEDRSVRDAATILGCGTESAKTHLRRAKATLARRLRVDDEENDREPAG